MQKGAYQDSWLGGQVFICFALLALLAMLVGTEIARADDDATKSISVMRWVSAGKSNQYYLEYGRLDSNGQATEIERRANYQLIDPDVDQAAVGQWMVQRQNWEILVQPIQTAFPLQTQYAVGGINYWTLRPNGTPSKQDDSGADAKKNRFEAAANEGLQDAEKHADVVNADVAVQNRKANDDLQMAERLRKNIEENAAASRAKADAANAAAAAKVSQSLSATGSAALTAASGSNHATSGGTYAVHTAAYVGSVPDPYQGIRAATGTASNFQSQTYSYSGQTYYITWVDVRGVSKLDADQAVKFGRDKLPGPLKNQARITSCDSASALPVDRGSGLAGQTAGQGNQLSPASPDDSQGLHQALIDAAKQGQGLVESSRQLRHSGKAHGLWQQNERRRR